MKLLNLTAVITGAAKGIGREIALNLAQEGAFVVLIDLEEPVELLATLHAQKLQGMALVVDIADFPAVLQAVQDIIKVRGRIDILVNNAGIIARESLLDLTVEQWKHVMDVNVNGTFYWCKATVPFMIAQQYGRIVNITSIAAKTGDLTASPAYGTSKGAITTLTRSLARQLAEYGITVNAVAPHAIETDMSNAWSEKKREQVINSLPVKRMGTTREVAAGVLYLVSKEAAFTTGETMNINGGYLMD